MNHAECAEQNFRSGCNCPQSVLLAFCDVTGLEPDTALRVSSAFGGGVGRLRNLCGAVSGMLMAAGLLYGGRFNTQSDKADYYALVRSLVARFQAEYGSIFCRDLLADVETTPGLEPEARTPEYYARRPCPGLCAGAAGILEEYLAEHPSKR